MIQNIAIEKLHAHPDNPRKDVGDVTELAESIKTSGILQNLTVVPCTGYYHGDYTVIIGHRRLAASKAAGLTEVPCAIVEMDEKEQIATMLLENMQRSDLTVYEQAQGMQMMLDLGESVKDISEKTGFSQSTVKRRVKLLQLDGEKFKASEGRQVGITEYDKLFEIEDEDKRNELLDCIGTANFNNRFKMVKDEEERQRKRAGYIELLKAVGAVEITHGEKNDKKWLHYVYSEKDIPAENDGHTYFYAVSTYALELYRDYTDEEREQRAENIRKREADERREEQYRKREAQFRELRERFYELRVEFVENCDVKNNTDALMKLAAFSYMHSWANAVDLETVSFLIGEKIYKEDSWRKVPDREIYEPLIEEAPGKILLYAAYSHMRDDNKEGYHDFRGQPNKNEKLDMIYKYLEMLGYEMSDEEKAYRDGTHEIFGEKGKGNE